MKVYEKDRIIYDSIWKVQITVHEKHMKIHYMKVQYVKVQYMKSKVYDYHMKSITGKQYMK